MITLHERGCHAEPPFFVGPSRPLDRLGLWRGLERHPRHADLRGKGGPPPCVRHLGGGRGAASSVPANAKAQRPSAPSSPLPPATTTTDYTDPHLGDALQVTVIATGFSATNPIGAVKPAEPEKVVYELRADSSPGSQFNLFEEPVRSKSPLETEAVSPVDAPIANVFESSAAAFRGGGLGGGGIRTAGGNSIG